MGWPSTISVAAAFAALLALAACHGAAQEECKANDGDCSGDESNLLQHRLQSSVKSGRQALRWDALEGLPPGESLEIVEQQISHRFEEIQRHHAEGTSARGRDAKLSAAFFEMCKPGDAARRKASTLQEKHVAYACQIPSCDLSTHMVLQEDTAAGVVHSCCPLSATYCGGCARANATGCERCLGGYTLIDGVCTACIDTVGWTGYNNATCWTATCSTLPVQGISSKEACCACGGGEQTATPFLYRAATVLLGTNFVFGGPVPRTATRYSLDDACELSKYGLTIDGSTGALMRAADSAQSSGLADLGAEAFDVSCTITAHQTASLNYSTTLAVSANWFSYESFNNAGVLIGSNLQPGGQGAASLLGTSSTRGGTAAAGLACHRHRYRHQNGTAGNNYSGTDIPLQNLAYMCYGPGKKVKSLCEFQLKCTTAQTSTWIHIDDDFGTLTPQPLPPPTTQPGVTGFGTWNDQAGNPGGKCEVTARRQTVSGFPGFPPGRRVTEIKFDFPIVAPKLWPSFGFATPELHATIGEAAPPLYVESPDASDASKTEYAKPNRFSIACTEFPAQTDGRTSFQFDTVTGAATLNGQSAFTLDTTTGAVRVSPAADVALALDGLDSAQMRRALELNCSVIAHYDDLEIGAPNPWLATPLGISIRDDTCWREVTAKFLKNSSTLPHQIVSASSEADCRSKCRADVLCTHYEWNTADATCTFNHFRCASSASTTDCDELTVQEKIKNCAELSTCLKLEFGHHWDLSGWYCPKGDMQFDGVAYERTSITPEDVLWLSPYNPERDSGVAGCAEGMWLIRRPDRAKDYLDSSKDLAELNGEVLVCFDAGGDLTNRTLADGAVTLTVEATPSDSTLLPILLSNTAESRIENPACPAPNMTEMLAEAESEGPTDPDTGSTVVPIVLDDPTTSTPDDHWLHPCSCFSPTNWGSESPVTSDSFQDIPAGSGNQYTPHPFAIVEGEYTCEPGSTSLIRIILLQDVDGADFEAVCQQRCHSDSECFYFFSGSAASTKQCRLYKQCTQLVREVGIVGTLYGMTSKQANVCRIANPDLCNQVSLRREFLGAPIDSTRELSPSPAAELMYRSLTEQCDFKLMNGQLGINKCGLASYSFQQPSFWEGKTPPPSGKSSGVQLLASCWDERYHPVPDVGTGPLDLSKGATTLTCLSGSWVGANGLKGLNGFACASCITVAKAPYSTLQKQTREELYFMPNKELNLYVMTVPPQKLDSTGQLVEAPLILVNETTPTRAVPPDFIFGTLTNTYVTTSVDLDYCVGVETNRKLNVASSDLSISLSVVFTPSSGSETLDSYESTATISSNGAWSSGTAPNRIFTSVSADNVQYVDTSTYPVGIKANTSEAEAQSIAYGVAYANYVGLPRVTGPPNQEATVEALVSKVVINGTEYTNSVANVLSGLAFTVSTFPQTDVQSFSVTNGTVTVTLTVDYSYTPVQEDVLRMTSCTAINPGVESVNLGWYDGDPSSPGPLLQIEGGTHSGKCLRKLDTASFAGADMLTVATCDTGDDWQIWEYLPPDESAGIINKLRLANQASNTYCLTAEGQSSSDWPLFFESCLDGSGDQRGNGALTRGIFAYDFAQDKWNMEQQDCFATTTVVVECSVTCGGGYSLRTISVTSANTGLGQGCPAAQVGCNMFACTDGGSGGFLPDVYQGASIGFKQFRSTGSLSDCLTYNASGQAQFGIAGCDATDLAQQLDTAQLPAMLWDLVRKNAAGGQQIAQVASVAKFSVPQQRKFLADLQITQDCGADAVVQEMRWGTWAGEPGVMVRCAAGVINSLASENIEIVNVAFPRSDLIETKEGGYCLSVTFEDLTGSDLSESQKSSLANKNMALVKMVKCDVDDVTQHFYWSGTQIRSLYAEGFCLYDGTGYLRLYSCNSSFMRFATWTYNKFYQLVGYLAGAKNCIHWMKATAGSEEQLKVAVVRTCMASSDEPKKVNDGFTEYSQGLWRVGNGIVGLNNLEIKCDSSTGSVLNYVKMTTSRITYKCVPLGAVGACKEYETAEVDTITANLQGVQNLDMNCTGGALLSFSPQLASGGETFKYKYTCCELTEPSALVLTGVDYSKDLETDQGIYCANESRDESGRLFYHQQSWFNQTDRTVHVMAFDNKEGEWCVDDGTTASCVANDNAVPTDTALENNDWQAVQVTNFDYSPEARGTTPPTTKIRKFPELIKFAAVQPQYAEECQDDVTPGNTGFDRDLMNKKYVELPKQNPCSLVGGVSKQDSADGEDKGLYYKVGKTAYSADRETKFGLTYKDAYECSSRAISRADTVWRTDLGFDVANQVQEGVSDTLGFLCDAFPEPSQWNGFVAGDEKVWQVPSYCKSGVGWALLTWKNIQKAVHMGLQFVNEDVERNDCDPIQVGFARSACDMHCIRDAIRSGTKAILKSMEKAASTQTTNNNLMLEYYSGLVLDKMDAQFGTGAGLLQEDVQQQFRAAQQVSNTFFVEMKGMLKESKLDATGEHALARALQSFMTQEQQLLARNVNRSKEDAGDMKIELALMTQRARRLHTVVKGAAARRLGKKEIVERRMHSFTVEHQEVLKRYSTHIGKSKADAAYTKHMQQVLMGYIQPTVADLAVQLEMQHVEEILVDIDSTWWELRQVFDDYLQGVDDHISAMQHSTSLMQEYTSMCSLPYEDFLANFRQTWATTERAKQTVKDSWKKAVPLLGLLASKLVDSNALVHFARADVLMMDAKKVLLGEDVHSRNGTRPADVLLLEQSRSGLCAAGLAEEVKEAARSVLHTAAFGPAGQLGLWGATVHQARVVLAELSGLAHWHEPLGLGRAPDVDDVEMSAKRLQRSLSTAVRAQNAMIEDAFTSFLKLHCHQ